MTYIENIFVCLAAPLFIATLCMGRKYYSGFIFCMMGMLSCLLSAYLNTFFTHLYNANLISATTQIAPVVEEIMKLLPLLFYLLIFEPTFEKAKGAMMIIAASFATFENIVYLTQNGAAQLSFLLIRGFGTGAMHIICGAVISFGIAYIWQNACLKIAGTYGLLCAAITFHAIFNLLIAHGGATQIIAYSMPILTMIAGKIIVRLFKSLQQKTIPD